MTAAPYPNPPEQHGAYFDAAPDVDAPYNLEAMASSAAALGRAISEYPAHEMEAVTPVTSPPRGSGERDLRTADQQLADDLAQANLRIDNLVDALAYANKRIDDLTRAMMVDMGGVGHKLAALEGEHAALSRAVNAQEQAASWRDRRIKTLEAEGRALAAALDRLAEHVTVLNLRSGL